MIRRFLRQHPVFTRDLFDQTIGGADKNTNTLKNTLAHHIKQGHIVRIKRGLFAAIPFGANSQSYPINPYLIASKLSNDAIIGYHTALAYYGYAYSSHHRFIYLTETKQKPLLFRGITYQPTGFPKKLVQRKLMQKYINNEDISGLDIRITSKERTLVDVLDRPILSGGWEEIWRSLNMINRVKGQDILEYTLALDVATTSAKVGFYLEQRKKELNIDESLLKQLEINCPNTPQHMNNASRSQCKLIKRWNLMVPASIINSEWEENLNWEPGHENINRAFNKRGREH